MLCSNVERFIFALSGQNLEDYCTRCNVTVTGRHTFCFLPPGPVHACVPGTWVHVPTLSVDGLIRIYMAHTAQIIYIICKILAYFLCYSLYSAPCYTIILVPQLQTPKRATCPPLPQHTREILCCYRCSQWRSPPSFISNNDSSTL